jgi:P27 family predicted phage terminase small subunit
MRRGPAPTHPTVVQLRGNPGQRRIPPVLEIPMPAEPLPAPDWLPGLAVAEWQRLAPVLHQANLLTQLDVAVFSAYCTSYDRWRQAEAALEASGELTTRGDRGAVVSPMVRVAESAARDVLKFGSEFGLTPSARLRLRAGAPEPSSKFDGLLGPLPS